MEEQLFYLIKDVGVPTFIAGFLAFGWYKLGTKVLTALAKNTQVIEYNIKVIENNNKIIENLAKKINSK